MNVINSQDNFPSFLYNAPESDGAALPFLLHAVRMGCGYQESFFRINRDNSYPYFTVHFLYDGCGLFHIAGENYLLKKGDAFIIPAGEAHSYSNRSDDPLGLIWIELSVPGCQELSSYFHLHRLYTIDASHTEAPLSRLISILHDRINQIPASPFTLSGIYYTFLMELLAAAQVQASPQLPELLTAALYYIGQHFTEDITIGQLADYLHVSHTYLTRIFRKFMGTTPIKYLNLKRLEYACFLLESSILTCGQIAERIGMYDVSHFNRFFSRQLGMPPSDYRSRKRLSSPPPPANKTGAKEVLP